jgi:hypothetical protein
MATESIPYVKLRGTGSNFVERISLYLAPDHLLQVSSAGYSESYLRFYFRDIQAITVRKTSYGLIFNIVWGVLAALFLALAVDSTEAAIAWGIVGGIFLGLLLMNFFAGPTCVCEIQTAVQKRKLGAVTRLRRAQRFIEQIRNQIQPAQGVLASEEIARRLDQLRQGGFFTQAPVAAATEEAPPTDSGTFR